MSNWKGQKKQMAKKKITADSGTNNTQAEPPDVPVEGGDNSSDFVDHGRNSIYAKRQEQIEQEIDYVQTGLSSQEPIDGEPAPAPEPTPEPAPAEAPQAESAPAAEPAPGEPAAAQVATDPAKKFKIVVEGQPMELTETEMLTLAQKGVGAEQKFREAASMRKQAQEMMFGSQNNSQALQQQPNVQANNQPQQAQLAHISDEKLSDIARKLDYGTEEDRKSAIREAILLGQQATGRTEGPTPDQLISAAAQQAYQAMQLQNENTLLTTEFKDIVSDPPIAHATDLIATQLAQNYASIGVPKQRLDILREAGSIARERYLRPVQTQNPPVQNNSVTPLTTVIPMSEKLEKKRAAPQPPSAASTVATMSQKEQVVAPSAVVAAMRQARGQA